MLADRGVGAQWMALYVAPAEKELGADVCGNSQSRARAVLIKADGMHLRTTH